MRLLVIAAHPDDETLGAGGTIARATAHGDEVWVCLLTEGVTARHEYSDLQVDCARKACDVLGVANMVFCGFDDQRLDALPLLEVIRPIERCVREFRPDVVYTHFGHDVNQDHRVAFHATMVATRPVNGSPVRRVLCFETPSSTEWAAPFNGSVFAPNVFVDITTALPKKLEAMKVYADTHVSEVHAYPHPRSYEAMETYAKRHGVVAGFQAAESFMLIRELDRDGRRPK